MADLGQLTVKINADTKDVERGLNRTQKATMAAQKAIKTLAVAGVAAMGAFGVKAIQLAADAEEMQNKFDVTFKTMNKEAENWAKTWSKSVGRSVNDTKTFISNIADLQQGLGMTEMESLDLSQKIVQLATDLASFNNVQDATAIEAVSKAMLGEAESAKQLGLLLNVDRVKAFAEAQGLVWKEVTDAERAMLVYELAVTQSQNAIGDAERSSASFTNQMKALKSTLADNAANIGASLLPSVTKLVTFINETVIPGVGEMSARFKEFVDRVSPPLIAIFNELKTVGTDVFNTIKPIIAEAFDTAKERALILWQFFNDNILPIYQKMLETVQNNFPMIKEVMVTAFNAILKVSNMLWDFFEKNLLPIFKALYQFVIDNWPFFEAIFVGVMKATIFIIEAVVEHVGNMLEILGKVIKILTGTFKAAVDIGNQALDSIIGTVQSVIKVFTTVTDTIRGAISALKDFFSAKEGSEGPLSVTEGRGRGGSSTIRGGKAFGGAVQAGQSYLVGERGREVFTPSTNGTVGAVGNNVTVNINGAADPYTVADQIVNVLNANGVKTR